MNPVKFVERLSTIRFDNSFNPYADRCSTHDKEGAPECRSETLLKIIEIASERKVDSFWIGRDLGYRGGRRTGLAFTDDVHYSTHVERWGLSGGRPTKGYPVKERTATVVWTALSRINQSVFLWNVFPFHPHEAGNPFSNRPHSNCEQRIGEDILQHLFTMLDPVRLIAIGKAAEQTVQNLGCEYELVRHPSYGGQTEFLTKISKLYDLPAGPFANSVSTTVGH